MSNTHNEEIIELLKNKGSEEMYKNILFEFFLKEIQPYEIIDLLESVFEVHPNNDGEIIIKSMKTLLKCNQ
jgi:hypothetical protein